MRVKAISRLLQGQDVCIFCAFRVTLEAQSSRRQSLQQSRSYRSTAANAAPAHAAAVAEKEEEDGMDYTTSGSKAASHPVQKPRRPYTALPSMAPNREPNAYDSQPHPRRPRFSDSRPAAQNDPPRFGRTFDSSRGDNGAFGDRRNGNERERPWYQVQRPPGDRPDAPYGTEHAPVSSPVLSSHSQSWRDRGTTTASTNTFRSSPAEGRSRFGAMVDKALSNSADTSGPHTRTGTYDRTSRFGRFVDKAGLPEPDRTVPAPRPRPAPEKGSGVFGLAELEKSASSTSTPQTRGRYFDDQTRGVLDQRQLGRRTEHQARTTSAPATEELAVERYTPIASIDPVLYEDSARRSQPRFDRADRRRQRFETEDDSSAVANLQTEQRKKTARRQRQNDLDDNFTGGMDDIDEELEILGKRRKKVKAAHQSVPAKPIISLPEFISVEKLAQILKVKLDTFISRLEEEGFEGARYDHMLDAESSAMFADLYGFEPVIGNSSVEDLVAQPPVEDRSLLPPRPPIVTIMGHVDHGKTTILDWLRKSSVVESEHGGITQHIGAFSFMMPGSDRQITFLDTPGHAAFLDMRRRGANVTDIVVLVVAADDSVKPQTIEAIKHALDANVHIIVAINKVDKQDADIERVKGDLAKHEITVESYGGEYQAIPVSGKTGQGMPDLEEAILTLADVSDFRAETDGPAEGWIIESKVTTAGRVATVLVRRGTIRPGNIIVAGTTWSRVRTLRNDAGNLVDEAPPGTPVQIDGWRGDPTAGLEVLQADDEAHAKSVVDLRLEKLESLRNLTEMAAFNNARSEEAEARAKVLEAEAEQKRSFVSSAARRRYKQATDNEGWVEGTSSSGPKQVHFVVKADVAGSVEAIVAVVSAIGNHEISANVIHSGAGLLTESDIKHLAATGETAYAISFNQPIDNAVARLAEAAGLQILDHNVIYKVTDDVKAKLSDALPPLRTQRVLGEAEVGQIFEITTKKGKIKIAGCRVSNGTVDRSHKIRVVRGGKTVYTGTLDSLKNVKKDVTEMRKGSECGIGFYGWTDFEVGDQVQCFEEHEEKRKLW